MKSEQLTSNFWLAEFLQSNEAARKRIPNIPDSLALKNIRAKLAPRMQLARDILRFPVIVTSGFRSVLVNTMVGGSRDSAHMQGLAADFICPGFGIPLDVAKKLADHAEEIGFDQLIHEGTWVHLGFPAGATPPRRQLLTAHFRGGEVYYTKGLD